MSSMTDYVVEGLKYPFNDIKKLLCFGAIFAILNLISIAINTKNLDIYRVVVRQARQTNASMFSLKFTQLPTNDIYLAIILTIISFIILLFIMGYQYKIVKFSINESDSLPGFADISNIFVNGIKFLAVGVAYNIIPTIVLTIGVVLLENSSMGLVITFIAFVLYLISFFFMIMALGNMVAKDSIKKAFDLNEIICKIDNIGWVKYVGIIIFTVIIFMIVYAFAGLLLGFITILFARVFYQAIVVSAFMGIIQGLFITAYTTVFFNRVCGSIYRQSIK